MSQPTEPTDTVEANGDWLAPGPAAADRAEGATDHTRRRLGVRIGLVGAGAVVGALVVATVSHGSPGTSTSAVNSAGGFGQPPGGQFQGGPFQGGRSQGGPVPDEQHVAGILTGVGSSTVTVRTDAGTAVYRVVAASQIVRDGRVVALSALRVGDPVFVHVYPDGSGSRLVVERLFAGSFGAVPGAT